MSRFVYVSGQFCDERDAHVPFDDRGFIFADGLYEVIRYYDGRPFRLDEHLHRLREGAEEISLAFPDNFAETPAILDELARRNHVEQTNFSVYLQVTRGADARAHVFPAHPRPTVVAWILPVAPASAEIRPQTVITVLDRRWSMCHLKTTALMLNVLAKQEAAEAGADEALFVRDDVATECAVSNFFGVREGDAITHPTGPHILSGITRRAALQLLSDRGVDVDVSPIRATELESLDEAFITGTGCEIAPVVAIDSRPVGDGQPGPITRRLIEDYRRATAEPRAAQVA